MTNKQLPNNWTVTNLRKVVSPTKGKKPIRLENSSFAESVPYIDIKALELSQINQYADIKSSKLFSEGDIAIVWDGARSGWVAKAHNGAIGSTLCALTPIKIDSTYLYYYLLSKYSLINSKPRGVGIPHVDPKFLWSLEIPLPPTAEQKRIADKLDTLFGQLSTIQKALERIPELIKNFRQQVLTSAVSGKLTEEWRKKQEPSQWRIKKLSDVATPKSGYPFKASDFVEQGIQVIRMGNLYNNKLSLERNPVFIPKEYNAEIINKSTINKGDILLTLTGTKYKRDYGYAIKVDSDDTLLLNQRILALSPIINVDYLLLVLREEDFRNHFFSFETGGVNQGNVGIKNVMTIPINVPPAKEQTKIVEITNSLFKKLETIEQQYNALKAKIEKLPQTLLNKAFSGELVDHLPSDGNAEDLLKEIEQLKRSTKKK